VCGGRGVRTFQKRDGSQERGKRFGKGVVETA